MPPKSFHFVASSGNDKAKDEDTRKLVRENAMRAFRRRQRLARVDQYQQTQANARESVRSTGTAYEPGWHEPCQDVLLTGQSSALDLFRGPGHEFDPFASTMLPESHRGPQFFWHFVNQLAPRLQPTGMTLNAINAYVTRSAISDPGLLSTIMFHSGLHLDSQFDKTDQSWSPETLHHQGESIQELNRRLQGAESAASDSSIAIVGFLSASVNITGNVVAEVAHRNALQKMVEIRGGLDRLGKSGALATLITIGDIISSTIAGTAPVLPAPDISCNHLFALEPSSNVTAEVHGIFSTPSIPLCFTPNSPLPSTSEFETEVDTVLDFTRRIVILQTTLFSRSTTALDDTTALTQLSSAIEHRLLSLPTVSPDAETNASTVLNGAKKIALQIICAYIFRGFRSPAPNFIALSSRLEWLLALLDDGARPEAIAWSVEQRRILLWIYVAGALASTPRDLEAPAMRIVDCMRQLGLRTWEDVKAILEESVWCARCEDAGCQKLWLCVQALITPSP